MKVSSAVDEKIDQSEEDMDDTDQISVAVLGVTLPINPNDTEIYHNAGRIKKIENLDKCIELKSLGLSAQQIERIEGLDYNVKLESLELYQNFIGKIENIQHLKNLRILDLSFNDLSEINGLESLRNLKKLFLSSNKISQIKGLESLIELTLLELGANRIRKVEGIESLLKLEELWLGKNKITSMALPSLPSLKKLSMQSNRLIEWDSTLITNAPNLEEIYLSQNQLVDIPDSLKQLTFLRTLDLAGNKITTFKSLSGCKNLEELWFNDNKIPNVTELQLLKDLKKLDTLYLERNPIQYSLGPGYRNAIIESLPWITQLDAQLLKKTVSVTVSHDDGIKSVMKSYHGVPQESETQWLRDLRRNPAIQKLRKVEKLVKIGKIEKQLVATASSMNEHLVFVHKGQPRVNQIQKSNELLKEENDFDMSD